MSRDDDMLIKTSSWSEAEHPKGVRRNVSLGFSWRRSCLRSRLMRWYIQLFHLIRHCVPPSPVPFGGFVATLLEGKAFLNMQIDLILIDRKKLLRMALRTTIETPINVTIMFFRFLYSIPAI